MLTQCLISSRSGLPSGSASSQSTNRCSDRPSTLNWEATQLFQKKPKTKPNLPPPPPPPFSTPPAFLQTLFQPLAAPSGEIRKPKGFPKISPLLLTTRYGVFRNANKSSRPWKEQQQEAPDRSGESHPEIPKCPFSRGGKKTKVQITRKEEKERKRG